jgi:hypothetical protein
MNAFERRLKSALTLLRSKPIEIMDFWVYFEQWIDSIPNSEEDRASIKGMTESRVFKMDLLLAFHLLGDTPLKKVLEERIRHCVVTHQEWEDTAQASFDIKRKR